MVWNLPPSACVHVTHGTRKIESKCEESERKFPLFGIKPRNSLREKKEFGRGRKGKEKKGEKIKRKGKKERKGIKEKKGEKEKKGRKERKERKTRERRKNPCVEEKGERKENAFDSRCSDGRKSLVRELKLVY